MVTILGGEEYRETASVFRIFCFYGLLLPIDRFTGVALDSVNMPKQNFIKVVYMTLSNIIGDAIVVFGLYYVVIISSVLTLLFIGYTNPEIIGETASMFTMITLLDMVAVVTILFTIVGIVVGTHFLKKALNIKIRLIFSGGLMFYANFFIKK